MNVKARAVTQAVLRALGAGAATTLLAVPAYAPLRRPVVGLVAGVALGLALISSPAIGGAFSLIYGITAVWHALRARSNWFQALLSTEPAIPPRNKAPTTEKIAMLRRI